MSMPIQDGLTHTQATLTLRDTNGIIHANNDDDDDDDDDIPVCIVHACACRLSFIISPKQT